MANFDPSALLSNFARSAASGTAQKIQSKNSRQRSLIMLANLIADFKKQGIQNDQRTKEQMRAKFNAMDLAKLNNELSTGRINLGANNAGARFEAEKDFRRGEGARDRVARQNTAEFSAGQANLRSLMDADAARNSAAAKTTEADRQFGLDTRRVVTGEKKQNLAREKHDAGQKRLVKIQEQSVAATERDMGRLALRFKEFEKAVADGKIDKVQKDRSFFEKQRVALYRQIDALYKRQDARAASFAPEDPRIQADIERLATQAFFIEDKLELPRGE